MINYLLKCLANSYPFKKGRGRVLHGCIKRLRGPYRIVRDKFGHLRLLDVRGFIDGTICIRGGFETTNLVAFSRMAAERQCDALLDIGANMGLYAIHFAANPAMREVHAFEPDPRNYAQLAGNLFINDSYDRVIAHPIALSNQTGNIELYLSRGAGKGDFGIANPGASGVEFNAEHHDPAERRSVPMRRLDDIFTATGRRVAVKIDVEGHELPVLQGMEQCLRTNDCVILVEVFEKSIPEVDGFLRGLGYQSVEAPADIHSFYYAKR